MPYLIDGHNLLWAIFKQDERFAPVDDVTLSQTIGSFVTDINDSGELVFDGTGPRDTGPFKRIDGLRVVFAGDGLEADDVIEYRIDQCVSPKKLILISNDRRVKRAGLKRKATILSCEDFWEAVLKRLAYMKRRVKEPPEKRQGLSQAEADSWLKLFGFEP